MADSVVVNDAQKGVKRKREKQKFECLTPEERNSWKITLNGELKSLFRYFDEVLSTDLGLGFHFGGLGKSVNAMIALLLEEKSCPYSKLVNGVYERLKEKESGVTIASVKSSVLHVGQRVAYGVLKPDVDVLEDETWSSLWCWETRDMKFLPHSLRGALKVRRTCRKKINERITAISDVISCLQNPEGSPTYTHDMTKSTDKLSKVLAEADIRKLVESLTLKNESRMDGKETKRKDLSLIKELEKSNREAEKEKKKLDHELQKEKLQSEREKKRVQLEAEKDEKRREKEEFESKKSEREQRRREKEEAERKKQLTVQKQASIMERFLKRSKTNTTTQNDTSPSVTLSDSNDIRNETAAESVSLLMDSALQQKDEFDVEEIWKSHVNSWRRLSHSIRCNDKLYWGLRKKPKTQLIKELKLTKEPARNDDLCIDSFVDGWEQTSNEDKSCRNKTSASASVPQMCLRRKQLLQFDKSNRPAFYGIWPKKSSFVSSRHPLMKDPDLDYDIDSDEEWEEEEPGESLSDSEKEEEETLGEVSLKADDAEDSEDGFFVPDGYLSENEGVETDRTQRNVAEEVTDSSSSRKPEAESEEHSGRIRQQKYLYRLTEHALKKNQPLIIVNMMHEKTQLLSSEDVTGTLKVEQMCLQALTMHAFPVGLSIEVPSDDNLLEENEVSTPSSKGSGVSITDAELREIVSAIQSYGQGINRVLEALQQTLPDIPKSHLRNKVREISDFVENRWKVKKEILHKLGMSSSPGDSSRGRTKTITKFFPKRCLPPSGHLVNLCEFSPEPLKPSSSNQLYRHQQQERTENV